MSQDQIMFACLQDSCYFKLSGELRYTNASGMDDLIEQLFEQEQPACARVIVDLNDATFMDSTHIGLLASLARHCQHHNLPKPTLFSTRPEINELLLGLCLDDAFDFVQQPTNPSIDLTTIRSEAHTDDEQGLMILRAHEALIELNNNNESEFRSVVDLLKQQLK